MSNILDFYSQLMHNTGLTTDDKGNVFLPNETPAMVGDKRLVLPTPDQLAKGEDDKVVLHSLRENTLRNDSPIMTYIKKGYNVYINGKYLQLAIGLINVLGSSEYTKKVNAQQLEIVNKLGTPGKNTITNLCKVYQKATKSGKADKVFTNIYIKRGGKIDDVNYSRVGVISNPILEELTTAVETDSPVYGVKMAKRDKQFLLGLFTEILPTTAQNKGSNSTVAPNTGALLNTVSAIADLLTAKSEPFADMIQVDATSYVGEDKKWLDSINDKVIDSLKVEIMKIPMQPGNEGNSPKAESKLTEKPSTTQPAPASSTPPWEEDTSSLYSVETPALATTQPTPAPAPVDTTPALATIPTTQPVVNGMPSQQPPMVQTPMGTTPQQPQAKPGTRSMAEIKNILVANQMQNGFQGQPNNGMHAPAPNSWQQQVMQTNQMAMMQGFNQPYQPNQWGY